MTDLIGAVIKMHEVLIHFPFSAALSLTLCPPKSLPHKHWHRHTIQLSISWMHCECVGSGEGAAALYQRAVPDICHRLHQAAWEGSIHWWENQKSHSKLTQHACVRACSFSATENKNMQENRFNSHYAVFGLCVCSTIHIKSLWCT